MDDVYQALALKLNELPNGYPATESGVEIRILQKIFDADEAAMALRLLPFPETPEAVSQRTGLSAEEVTPMLETMADKGQIGSFSSGGNQVYVLVPFIIGIYEFQLKRLDKELSDLLEEYAPHLMSALGGFAPALTRVVPINAPINAEHQVHRYEDISAMLAKAKSFQVHDCICRKERALQGETCKHSVEVCLSFSNHEDGFGKHRRGRMITKDEAMKIMKKAEEEGLVHTTYNVESGQMYICNCCSCCCGILLGIKKFNAPYLMAKSNFVALIDQDTCQACGICADERCPVNAIIEEEGEYRVMPERCIGCGACTTGCPVQAISLIEKPAEQHDGPPRNLIDWYMKRAQSRGISLKI